MVKPIAPNIIHSGIAANGDETDSAVVDDDAASFPGNGAVTRRRARPENPPQRIELERNQIERDGAYIYREFLNNEFRRRNLPHPGQYIPEGAAYHTLNNPSPDLSRAIDQLRIVSAEFAQTPMRQWVEEQAARVPLESLDFQAFSQLLYGLFQEGGVTWERIVVLFYFCTDVAARAIRESIPPRFQCIVEWSFLFFSGDRMIQWVFDHGGWLGVLQDTASRAYRLAKMGVMLMGAFVVGVYLWKSQ